MSSLAAELATGLLPTDEILERHGCTEEQLKELLTDHQFVSQLREYKKSWNGPLSARERVRMKSALAVEDGLVALYQIFQDNDLAPAARIDAYKQLIGLADMQPKKEGEGTSSGFNLVLNLGGAQEPITISGTAIEPEPEEATFAMPLPE